MRLVQLEVTDLRNIRHVRLELCSGLNYFYGDNGAGKTAILEAVALLFNGRSFRSPSTKRVIREGQGSVVVRAVLEDAARGRTEVAISRDRKNHTELRLNGSKTQQMSAVASLVAVQVMLPDISGLVFDGPALRRRMLDWGVFHVEPEYLRTLQRYQRALSQRNAALKQLSSAKSDSEPQEALAVWDPPVVSNGESVARMRRDYVEMLRPHFDDVMRTFAPELNVSVELRDGWGEEASFADRLTQSLSMDVKFGATQSGPHRADLRVKLGGSPAADVASRGQGKILASAIKLAQARMLFLQHGRESLFLIDDLGAELDVLHNRKFFEILEGMNAQILATSIHRSLADDAYREGPKVLFHVEQGAVCTDGDVH